jgi:hypothetical protein
MTGEAREDMLSHLCLTRKPLPSGFHRSGLWVTLPLLIGGRWRVSAVLDTGSPVSAIGPSMGRTLADEGLLQPSLRAGRHLLKLSTVQDQPLPELQAGILRRLDRIDVELLLGFDFLLQFAEVHFDTRTMILRLVTT